MTDSAAVFGKLMMPLEPVQGMEAVDSSWGDIPINGFALIAACLLFLFFTKDFYRIFPALWQGVFRNKSNVILEDSISLITTRNRLSIPFIYLLCLVADRFLMPQSNIIYVIVSFLVYWLYKFIIAKRIKATRVDLNITIVMTTALIITWIILELINFNEEVANHLILFEMSAFYFIQILRESQFFMAKHPAFRTFLYLCALEFLPLGMMTLLWPQ